MKIIKMTRRDLELCLDVSHSFMWCNHKGSSLSEFIHEISPKVSHIHISDAAGESEEGLQVGEGDLNFSEILQAISSLPSDTTLLPEIWQGHDNDGQGFKIALNRLSELGY